MRYTAMMAAALLVSASQSAFAQTRAEAGHALAQQWCSGCHQVEAAGLARDVAPSFLTLAQERGPDMDWVRTRMQVPLYPMQGINLSHEQIEDMVAYFETLPKE